MKRYQCALILTAAMVGGVGIGLYVINETEFGSFIKSKLGHLSPIPREAVQTMSEEVAMRAAQATHNPRINQAWIEKQWEEVGY